MDTCLHSDIDWPISTAKWGRRKLWGICGFNFLYAWFIMSKNTLWAFCCNNITFIYQSSQIYFLIAAYFNTLNNRHAFQIISILQCSICKQMFSLIQLHFCTYLNKTSFSNRKLHLFEVKFSTSVLNHGWSSFS